MCVGSHTAVRTHRPSSPDSFSQRARSWLSLVHTASPAPGVPMGISQHQRGATHSFPQRDRHLG